jgi:uncharacterized damage-inducible protein DinB
MPINESLLAEMKTEAAKTRKMLERVPLDKANWKPHEKSMALGRLATHVAETPRWFARIIEHDEFDFAASQQPPHTAADTNELLQIHDSMIAQAANALENANDGLLNKSFTMRAGNRVFYNLPKTALLRSFAYSHLFHHRGQLSVYLRLLDVQVPGMYGNSADEK